MFEMTAEHIEKSWPLFEKYYEKYKEGFKENGHKSLIEACRWLLAYSFAEQFCDENLRSMAHTFRDGMPSIPKRKKALWDEMAFNYSNYKAFITFYSYPRK